MRHRQPLNAAAVALPFGERTNTNQEMMIPDQPNYEAMQIEHEIKELSQLDRNLLSQLEIYYKENSHKYEIEQLSRISSEELQAYYNYIGVRELEIFDEWAKELIEFEKYRDRFRLQYGFEGFSSEMQGEIFGRFRIKLDGRMLPNDGLLQLAKYIYIIEKFKLRNHWVANKVITLNNDWDNFNEIRSYNYHGSLKTKGIRPEYFYILRQVTDVRVGRGRVLDRFEEY